MLKAEVCAILSGLQMATVKGWSHVLVESDSLLAVRKVTGSINKKDPLYPLLLRCQQLISSFEMCHVSHIFREANFCAEAGWALSNDAPAGQIEVPPADLMPFIQKDILGVARPRALGM